MNTFADSAENSLWSRWIVLFKPMNTPDLLGIWNQWISGVFYYDLFGFYLRLVIQSHKIQAFVDPIGGCIAVFLKDRHTTEYFPTFSIDIYRTIVYTIYKVNIPFKCLRMWWQRRKRIENRVRIPDGTAAVCVEAPHLTKVGHWGNLRRLCGAEDA